MAKILAFSGSTRKESVNQQLATAASAEAQKLGAEVTLINLRDYELPLYNGDLEEEHGVPINAVRLFEQMKQHDGLLLACPEYNGSITPVLKNAIDWLSRPFEGEESLAAYKGKTATLLSASPGGFGGMRGLVHVRAILSGIGVLVLPGQVSVGQAHTVFNEEGAVQDSATSKRLSAAVAELVRVTDQLN